MKNLIFVTVTLLCLLSCEKESEQLFIDSPIETRTSNNVYLCHTTGHNMFNLIKVKVSVVPAHLDHGDTYPDECYDSGLYMDKNCKLIDVSIYKEVCGNGIDDNCDGLTDSEDDEACGCPCYTLGDVLEVPNIEYYNYLETNCAGTFVGFTLPSHNYGVNPELNLALSPSSEVCLNLTDAESTACQRILESAQRILTLPPFCGGFNKGDKAMDFFSATPSK